MFRVCVGFGASHLNGKHADWDGVIFLQQELYSQGVFRFRVDIPLDFPSPAPPRVFFLSNIFHPAIDPATGELNLARKFPAWRWVCPCLGCARAWGVPVPGVLCGVVCGVAVTFDC